MATRMLARAAAAALLLVPAALAGAQRLTPLSFLSWSGSINSNVVLPSPDETLLFVSNQGSASVSVLAIAPGGALSLLGIHPTGPQPCGMARNPAGDRLYVEAADGVWVHSVGPDGALALLQAVPRAMPGPPLLYTGIQYVPLPSGDFVYVNENASPANAVSAYRVEPDGTLSYAGSTPTGDAGSLSGLYAPPRLLAAEGGRLFAANGASVSVLAIGPDGALALAPGSPHASPFPPGPVPLPAVAVAADPSGGWLYATFDGVAVVRFTVLPDGDLAPDALFTSTATYPITGLAVHPSGVWLAAASGAQGIRIWDTAAPGEPIQAMYGGAGIVWNDAGDRLFVGGGSLVDSRVRLYRFGPGEVTASCVGTPAARVPLAAPPDACTVAVDAANGLAGTCADAGGGLASCTFDGQGVLALGLGPADVTVTATSSSGATASCTSYVEVLDATPPTLAIGVAPTALWPPNHRLVHVAVEAATWDACDPAPAVSCGATSSEPDDGLGDGDTAGDVQMDETGLWLRAERSGRGAGRVYDVQCAATDASGNAGYGGAQVIVPHDLAR